MIRAPSLYSAHVSAYILDTVSAGVWVSAAIALTTSSTLGWATVLSLR
ncbi:hypothetical protein SAMN05446934_9787 [Paraburkholderia hospita]|nr:hypothetical protein PMI06_009054 [Burkholderia sp. BT03]SKC56394.1 hypothetical protein SAMN06266956_0819 [Paraburkholderia hospita]SKD05924.1 hypothetical protein SAMN05446934_9787 [Paraburkholderia hospita]